MMLTKQDREKIAKRLMDAGELNEQTFYKAITGRRMPDTTSYNSDLAVMSHIVRDLCDTSDMIELPRDKDDVPIHIGDTVWCHGVKRTVKAIKIYETMVRIVYETPEKFISWSLPELVTHDDPISDHESIARAIEDIVYRLNDAAASLKLQDIAMEIRELGESND